MNNSKEILKTGELKIGDSQIIIYQAPDGTTNLDVRLEEDTVWLTQVQIAQLFGTQRQAITKHLKNIFNNGELTEFSVSSILELTASDGKVYNTKFYNLDVILSVVVIGLILQMQLNSASGQTRF